MKLMIEFLNELIYLFYDLIDDDEPTMEVIRALIEDIGQDETLNDRERLESALAYGWLIGSISVDDTEIADEYRGILRRLEAETSD